MTELLSAAWEVGQFLTEHHIPYVVIGGLAVQEWGNARLTVDADKLIRVCSAEDLIIHKAVAGRPQDIVDIEGVVLRQSKRLDVAYIRRWLREFSDLLANPDVLERFERPYRKLRLK